MKKIAKLSLVAAVAVAGLSTANAKPLEEAIKNVDVSGQFRFRAQEKNTGDINTDVEIEVGVKAKVTDNVTAVFKIDAAPNNGGPDADKVDVEDYYFSYKNGDTTVNFGEQNIPSRQLDGQQGTGLVALTKVGPATVGAAYFVTSNASANNDVASVLASAKFGPVSTFGQYVQIKNLSTKGLNLKVDGDLGVAKVGAEMATIDKDDNKDYGTTKVYAAAKVGMVNATLAYATTENDGSGSFADDAEAPAEFLLWQMGSAGVSDLSAFALDVNAAVTPKVSVRVAYADGEAGNTDLNEILGQVSYKVAKNLSTYFRYSEYEVGNADAVTRGRIEAKFTF